MPFQSAAETTALGLKMTNVLNSMAPYSIWRRAHVMLGEEVEMPLRRLLHQHKGLIRKANPRGKAAEKSTSGRET